MKTDKAEKINQVIKAWSFLRLNNNDIPDDILDLMKESAIREINASPSLPGKAETVETWSTKAVDYANHFMQIRDLTDEEWLKLSKEEILQLYKNCKSMLENYIGLSGQDNLDVKTVTSTDYKEPQVEAGAEKIIELREEISNAFNENSTDANNGQMSVITEDSYSDLIDEIIDIFYARSNVRDEDIENAATYFMQNIIKAYHDGLVIKCYTAGAKAMRDGKIKPRQREKGEGK